MIEKLDLLQCKVDEFEREKKTGEIMLVAVVSIGDGLAPETNE